MRIAICLVIVSFAAAALDGAVQDRPAKEPAFEVVSIKRSSAEGARIRLVLRP